jgi:hypothetical protein
MDANQPKPRRWFRFSLRTMFVLVTVGCVWLGWEVNQVRVRAELRNSLKKQFEISGKEVYIGSDDSWRSRFLGDLKIKHVTFPGGSPRCWDLLVTAKAVFPGIYYFETWPGMKENEVALVPYGLYPGNR